MHAFISLLGNGGWSTWNEWVAIPVACGGGYLRTRECNNPTRKYGGKHCTADKSKDFETQDCQENLCPSKSKSR